MFLGRSLHVLCVTYDFLWICRPLKKVVRHSPTFTYSANSQISTKDRWNQTSILHPNRLNYFQVNIILGSWENYFTTTIFYIWRTCYDPWIITTIDVKSGLNCLFLELLFVKGSILQDRPTDEREARVFAGSAAILK